MSNSTDDQHKVHVLGRSVVCENSKWKVYFDHISDDAGNEVSDFLVIGPKNPRKNLITGICVLPILDDCIGLIRYFRHPIGEFLWEIPRGFIDDNEEPEDAARRELQEETGLICAQENLLDLGFYLPEPSTLQARGAVFAALACRAGSKPDHDEIGLGDLTFFSVAEVTTLMKSLQIQDASTLIAIYRYMDWLRSVHHQE